MFDIGVGEASVSVRHRCWAASWWESASWDEPLSGRCGVHAYEARLDPTLIAPPDTRRSRSLGAVLVPTCGALGRR